LRVAENSSTTGVRYFHKDHLNSSTVVTDTSGSLVRRIVYAPYGNESASEGTAEVSYKYTDKEKDTTGLYYFEARYYDPEIGRFISVDPGKDGDNWYAYCRNNPVKYVDPTGKKAVQTITFHRVYNSGNFGLVADENEGNLGILCPTGIDIRTSVNVDLKVTVDGTNLNVTGHVSVGMFTSNENAGLNFSADYSINIRDNDGGQTPFGTKLYYEPVSLGLTKAGIAGIGEPTWGWTKGYLSSDINRSYRIPNESMLDTQPDLLSFTFSVDVSYYASDFLGISGSATLFSETIYFDEPGGQGTWGDYFDDYSSYYDYDDWNDYDYGDYDESWC
jgi:RHS repeat-associated protein